MSQQSFPGKVYHPRDGYISYERFWCIDEKRGSPEEYLALMAEVCKLKDGGVQGGVVRLSESSFTFI